MKPIYTITDKILSTVSEASLLLGRLQAASGSVPAPRLRKQNQIKTIQGTLAIEGNTLSLDQITAVIENKPVMGLPNEIREVQNAINVYSRLSAYKSGSEKSFLKAHADLLKGLIPDAGRYRVKDVGVLAGSNVAHIAPSARLVPRLMGDLFKYLKSPFAEHPFIKSSVFHYEIEFIHPFSDGNGRMGRLWQTLMLTEYSSVFAYIPIESAIKDCQNDYYSSLATADKEGNATVFIEFMVGIIHQALQEFYSQFRPAVATAETRLATAKQHFKNIPFKRQDYLELFKSLSTATASRDLKWGVDGGLLTKTGDKRLAVYQFNIKAGDD
jgi:Fic family protein